MADALAIASLHRVAGHLIWCDAKVSFDEPAEDARVDPLVLDQMDATEYRSADDIADIIGEIPWEVRRAADRLVDVRLATSIRRGRERLYRRAL